MRIGILGSGLMGSKLGTIFARAGHDVVFSYSHSERKLKRLAREAKAHARAGTPREATLGADAVLLAVQWSRVDDVLKQAGDLSGKVIISCSLPMNASDTALAVAHTSSGAEVLAKKVRKADVKKIAVTLIRDVGFEAVDTGPLRIARYLEPFALAMAQLAYEGDESPEIAYRIERFGK